MALEYRFSTCSLMKFVSAVAMRNPSDVAWGCTRLKNASICIPLTSSYDFMSVRTFIQVSNSSVEVIIYSSGYRAGRTRMCASLYPPCMFGNSSQVRSGNTLKRAFSLVGKGEHLSVLIHDARFLHFGKNPVRRALRHIERLVDIGQPHCSVFMNE